MTIVFPTRVIALEQARDGGTMAGQAGSIGVLPGAPMLARLSSQSVLIGLAAAAAYGWWHWARVQPAIDAETAARLRVRG